MALELQSSVTKKICHQRKQNKQRGTFKITFTFYEPLYNKTTSVTSALTFNMFSEWNDYIWNMGTTHQHAH